MRRRVVIAIMTVSAVVVLLFAVPLAFVFERFLDDRAAIDLEHRVDVVARSFDFGSASDPPEASDLPTGPVAFAIYSLRGARALGNGPDVLESQLRRATSGAATTIESGGDLVAVAPVVDGETVTGLVRGQRSLGNVDRDTRRGVAGLLVGAIAVLGVGLLLARRLAATLGDATEELSDAAQRLGSGDFTIDVPTVGIAELDRVASALNATAHRLDQLVAREQTFSANVSHQLRTPITGLRTAIETELAYPRADASAALHEALGDIERLERTVRDILALARAERMPTTPFDVRPVLDEACVAWNGRFAAAGRPLVLECPDALTAAGTPPLLRQAIDALLDNALHHGAGPTEVAATATTAHVMITVSDRGKGMPSMTREDASTRLGLALVQRLAQAQGGRFIPAPPGPDPVFQIILRAPTPAVDALREAPSA